MAKYVKFDEIIPGISRSITDGETFIQFHGPEALKLRDLLVHVLNLEPIAWRQIPSLSEGISTIEFEKVVDAPIDGMWFFLPVAR